MEESNKNSRIKLAVLLMLPLMLSLSTSPSPLNPSVPRVAAQATPVIGLFPRGIDDLSIGVGAHITYRVNITDAPSLNNFNVFLSYNATLLSATGLDDTGNILAGKSVVTAFYCMNGQVADPNKSGVCALGSGGDGPGIIHVGQSILGSVTDNPTTGLLFTVHFDVKAIGFTQIQIRSFALGTGQQDPDTGEPISVIASTSDGFFSNKTCGGAPCEPPTVIFDWTPTRALLNKVITFNASLSRGPAPNVNLTSFFWVWGEASTVNSTSGSNEFCDPGWCTNVLHQPLNTTAEHEFKSVCHCPVSLTVTDTDSIKWTTTITIIVIRSFVDLKARDILVSPTSNLVDPGAKLTLTAKVINTGTVALNGSVQIILKVHQFENKTLGDPLYFTRLAPNGETEVTATWDTTGYSPKIYRIDAVVPVVFVNATLHENVTINNVKSTFVQLVEPFSAGFSPTLLASTGIGILVVLGGGFALSWAKRRKAPPEL